MNSWEIWLFMLVIFHFMVSFRLKNIVKMFRFSSFTTCFSITLWLFFCKFGVFSPIPFLILKTWVLFSKSLEFDYHFLKNHIITLLHVSLIFCIISLISVPFFFLAVVEPSMAGPARSRGVILASSILFHIKKFKVPHEFHVTRFLDHPYIQFSFLVLPYVSS